MIAYWISWGVISAALLGFTLSRPHPYRLARFLAFESIISLVFLNAGSWFADPFCFRQLFSWLLLICSLSLAGHSFYLIKTRGEPAGDLEDTTRLITTGAYRYIRHPLYAALLLLAGGAFLKRPSLIGAGLLVSTLAGVLITARIEERHNRERFGKQYGEYMEKVRRFIPFIY